MESDFVQYVEDPPETRRISVVISEEDQQRLHRLIPWGLTSRIFRYMLRALLDLVEEHGDIVLGFLLSGKLSVLDLLRKGVPKDGVAGPAEKHKSDV